MMVMRCGEKHGVCRFRVEDSYVVMVRERMVT